MLRIVNPSQRALLKQVKFSFSLPERELMEYDVAIVGGGVAGLATAIKLKQEEKKY